MRVDSSYLTSYLEGSDAALRVLPLPWTQVPQAVHPLALEALAVGLLMLLRCRFCHRTYKPGRSSHNADCQVHNVPTDDLTYLEPQPCFYTWAMGNWERWGRKEHVDDS